MREGAVQMHEHAGDPCEGLLQEWHFRRELVDAYYRALRLLTPDSGAALLGQQEMRRDLNEKLAIALLALRHTSDQLRSCEREHAMARLVQ